MLVTNNRRALSRVILAIIVAIVVVVAAFGAVLLTNPGILGASSTTSSGNLVQLAQQEGSLSLVGGPATPWWNATTLAFEKAYPGIKVSFVRQAAGELGTTLQAQFASGQITYDVAIFSAPSPQYVAALNNGWLVSYKSPSLATYKWSSTFVDPQYRSVAVSAWAGTVWIYNTKDVPSNMVPHSWEDITNNITFWKGNLGLNDPRFGGFTWYEYYENIWLPYGVSAFQNLSKINPTYVSTVVTSANDVASGTLYGAYTSDAAVFSLIQQGAPVALAYPSSGQLPLLWEAGILKSSPHPYAAELYMDWITSSAGQTVGVQQGLAWSPLLQNMTPVAGIPDMWTAPGLITLNATQQTQVNNAFAYNSTLGVITNALGLPPSS
ncbi:MAG: extracellular solute-binding protein [archaeon]|nr:extracellular solute-binding protein [archaeon]